MQEQERRGTTIRRVETIIITGATDELRGTSVRESLAGENKNKNVKK